MSFDSTNQARGNFTRLFNARSVCSLKGRIKYSIIIQTMKKQITTTILALAFTITAFSQNVGIGATTPNSSAALDVTSDNKGILIPRMDSAKRVAIASPAEGLMVYQKNGTKGFYYYNGSSWVFVGSASGSAIPATVGNQGKILSNNGSTLTWVEPAGPSATTAVITRAFGESTAFDFSSFTTHTTFIVDAPNQKNAISITLPHASNFTTGTIITLALPRLSLAQSNDLVLSIPGCTGLRLLDGNAVQPGSGPVSIGPGIYRHYITIGLRWYEMDKK